MNRIGHLLFLCSLLWISVNSNFRGDEYPEIEVITLGDRTFSYKNEKYDAYGQLSRKNCNSSSFQCENTGKCILKDKLCDKIYDCSCEEDDKDCWSQVEDESDEDIKHCSNHEHNYEQFSCANDEFQCKHVRECISEHMFCNGHFDCSDHSDEDFNCRKSLNCTGKFQCKNGYCTNKKWVCDGTNDCPDNSDEINCDHYTLFSKAECTYANNRFLCKNKRCIPLEYVCNKNNDCGDWSDEHFKCNKTSCLLSTKCKHCTETLDGPKCYCPSGYKLNDTTCTDIDECQIYGICDQGCENLQGSYKCLCHPGYLLQNDKKTCKAEGGEATLLFASRNIIYGYHLDSQIRFNFLKNLNHIGNIAVNKDYLYWREWQNGTPELRKLDTRTHEGETLLTTGLSGQALLAVDWITGNIYFADHIYRHIGVCDDKGKYCTILAHDVKVSSFALLPVKGLMYYYEQDEAQNGKIQVREMDGNNKTVKTLIQKSFSMPFAYGLTIDYPNNRLYWMSVISNFTMRIQSAKLDGTDIRIVLDVPEQNNWHSNSLVVFENKLYWSNWDSRSIQSCDKFFGKNWDVLNHTNGAAYYSIEIDHSVMQTSNMSNPCQTNPCSQLCLLNRNNSYTCACSFEQELNTDQRTCKGEKRKEEIVIIAGNRIIYYTHELLGKSQVTTHSVQRDITEAVYDPITGTILAIDQQNHYVVRYDPIKRDFENLISIADMIVGGIAFDYIGNNIYLTNVKQQSIEVYSLTTREKTIFYINGEDPGYIELVPEEGIMYVTCRANDSIRLYKMNMNGLQSIILGIVPDKPRIIMQYDSDSKELYTNFNLLPYTPTHSELSLMHSLVPFMNNIIGQSMLRVISNTAVSLTVTKRSIFWTERNSRKLLWINKDTDTFFPFRSHFSLPLFINEVETPFVINVRGIEKTSGKGCQENNGKCSHVCLPTSSESFICACPPKMELSANNRTCIAQSAACPIGKIRCSEHAICINQEQKCDGHFDCPNGEDEYDCTSTKDICNGNCSKINCTKGQHKCHDGKCIPQSFACDGDYDCPDFSDELNCHNRTCALNEFMCETGKCIPEEFKCDGERDCPDGSDEIRNCYIDNLCGPGYFRCTNNRCISPLLKCNNVDDCGDDSDEKYCIEDISRNCKKNEYACKNSYICVSEKVRCDGKQDCPENDDEYQCLRCEEDEFKCHNRKKCIPMSWICDNTDDCGDNSDEIVCEPEPIKNNCQEFKCANNKCLPFSQVCDGHDDCLDGSDERGSCSTACENHNCQNGCLKTPNGAICECKAGYALFNGIHCNDINECEQNVCSQNCANTVGSFECSCRDGYVLRKSDKISCKAIGPPIRFITATRHDIRNISSNVRFIEVINQLSGISDISGIDSNALDDAIYWISDDEGTVNKINIKTQEILSMDNLTPTAISVDWITNNIYFNDNSHLNVIKVCNLEQRKCAVIKKMEGVEIITALIVDPINRYLFWSQTFWYKTGPKAEIYRTNLLGTDMKKIVFRNVSFVSGMAIDYTRSRLYWLDSYLNTIQSSNLDGDKRTMFLSTEKQQATAINIFEDSLYWLSGPNGYIKICKLYGNNICKIIDLGANNVRKYFTIFHIGKHPVVENLCKKQHCDHMCILTSDGTACICEDGVGSDTSCSGNEISVASKRILLEPLSESHPRHGRNVYGTVIAVILVVAAISGVYYYYQKYRFRFDSPNPNSFDPIHFQNPSFDRRDEVAVTLSSASSNIHPGQHEYMNPVNDKLLESAQESSLKRLKESTNQSEKNAKTEREASLINLNMGV